MSIQDGHDGPGLKLTGQSVLGFVVGILLVYWLDLFQDRLLLLVGLEPPSFHRTVMQWFYVVAGLLGSISTLAIFHACRKKVVPDLFGSAFVGVIVGCVIGGVVGYLVYPWLTSLFDRTIYRWRPRWEETGVLIFVPAGVFVGLLVSIWIQVRKALKVGRLPISLDSGDSGIIEMKRNSHRMNERK